MGNEVKAKQSDHRTLAWAFNKLGSGCPVGRFNHQGQSSTVNAAPGQNALLTGNCLLGDSKLPSQVGPCSVWQRIHDIAGLI